MAFAGITDRPGLYGSMHIYYNLSQLQYFLYNFITTLIASLTILLLCMFLYQSKSRLIMITFIVFIIFILLIVLCEIYLETIFVGK
jgi:hypothetical protein